MVSQRQKLARKKFKAENPALFPKPEPTPPKDPNKKKNKKKSTFKRKKAEPNEPRDPTRNKFTKRPLRVPGMKPGDSCYICKALDHIAKLCPQKAEWERNKICLLCRRRGHSMKRCPNKEDEGVGAKLLCYNCGESGHSLANCSQPIQNGGTKFANCFVCNEQGHLSKDCPKNAHGIYPKGGSCKLCGGVTHLARDCPDKATRFTRGHDKQAFINRETPTGKLTKFISGDELEDDFTQDTAMGSEETGKSSEPKQEEATILKKKKVPKLVIFEG